MNAADMFTEDELPYFQEFLRKRNLPEDLEMALSSQSCIADFNQHVRANGGDLMFQIIDCDAMPVCPEGFQIAPEREQLENRIKGKWVFRPGRIALHWVDRQYTIGLEGNDLEPMLQLSQTPALPANILDFFEKEENRIFRPKEWVGKSVCAWGTKFKDVSGYKCVRYIYYEGDTLKKGYSYLQFAFDESRPTLVDTQLISRFLGVTDRAELEMQPKVKQQTFLPHISGGA